MRNLKCALNWFDIGSDENDNNCVSLIAFFTTARGRQVRGCASHCGHFFLFFARLFLRAVSRVPIAMSAPSEAEKK